MRHEELQIARLDAVGAPAERVERGELSAPDLPPSVGIGLVIAYAGLVGLLALTIATAGQAPFMIVIDLVFLAAFFSVPFIFFRMEGQGRRPDMARFLSDGMMTNTGHVSGVSALVQMFVVPALLNLGILLIGCAAMGIL